MIFINVCRCVCVGECGGRLDLACTSITCQRERTTTITIVRKRFLNGKKIEKRHKFAIIIIILSSKDNFKVQNNQFP